MAVQHVVQTFANVLRKKAEHMIAMLLKQNIFSTVAAVWGRDRGHRRRKGRSDGSRFVSQAEFLVDCRQFVKRLEPMAIHALLINEANETIESTMLRECCR